MSSPAIAIAPATTSCASDPASRRVTYIIRGELAWAVLRGYVDVDSFAADCEAEIDCMSLKDIAAAPAA